MRTFIMILAIQLFSKKIETNFQTLNIHQQSSNTSNNQMTTIYNGNAFEYIKTDKNEEGQYECATCEQPFGDQGEVCWADVGEFNYKDGKPLCGYCCDEMRKLDEDEDDCDWFCEGVCGKGFYYGDGHHEEDDGDITNFWCCGCYAKRRGGGCGCEEEKDELCSAIDASGNCLF
jgi:hypothetical protein